MAGGIGGIGHRIRELDPACHCEEEARAERMGDAQEIAKIHRLGNAVDADGKISAHPRPLLSAKLARPPRMTKGSAKDISCY